MLALELDGDLCSHLIAALGRHRAFLHGRGLAEPPALIALQATVRSAVDSDEPVRMTITNNQEQSLGRTRPTVSEDDLRAREFLTRHDVARLAGVGIATVDRWLTNDQLPSHKIGRLRRVRRSDLYQFLGRAA